MTYFLFLAELSLTHKCPEVNYVVECKCTSSTAF